MIHLFCLTKGRSNDWLSSVVGFFKPVSQFENTRGVVEETMCQNSVSAASNLREQGFHIFKDRLPEDICDRLLQYAISNPCKARPMDGVSMKKEGKGIYPRETPKTSRYDFSTQDLLEVEDIQRLLADFSFASIAQDYLEAKPVIDVLSMWWHTSYSDKPDKGAAQYFHFDMDRPKWLKFFIYLTDVKPENGPHTFVKESHKTNGIPESMLKKGYARLTDEEVKNYYGEEKIIEFTAPRGTIIAEDTRGLHKGKHVEKEDRLILQIQFSNTLFGGYYPKAKLGKNIVKPLKEAVDKHPMLYASFL